MDPEKPYAPGGGEEQPPLYMGAPPSTAGSLPDPLDPEDVVITPPGSPRIANSPAQGRLGGEGGAAAPPPASPVPIMARAGSGRPSAAGGMAKTPPPYPSHFSSPPLSARLRSGARTPAYPHAAAGGVAFQAHLHKVASDLADILDHVDAASNPATSLPGSPIRRPASMKYTALPSQSPHPSVMGAAAVDPETGLAGEADVVPAHHVRRLTTTVVDMLRSMVGINTVRGRGLDADASALLWDNSSDLGTEFDGLSDISGLTGTTGATSNRDTEISAATALLKAQYLPQPEYRGDEVLPFYHDRNNTLRAVYSPGADKDKFDIEADDAAESAEARGVPLSWLKPVTINWTGLIVFIIFLIGFATYIFLRTLYTLPLGGNMFYGVVMLAFEILGGLTMIPTGLCLVSRVTQPPPLEEGAKPTPTALDYHVRVLIPCYKEPLDVIQKTFMAAMYAPLPPNCRRSVYLLDDGKDPEKRRFVRALDMPNAVYISGRKRVKGEMNGKSANINNAMRLIYPPGVPIPLDEVIAVFDADQVANADFFTKTVPRLDQGQDVAMVLSPQTFYNLNPDGDIFNHGNVHFWHYTQPGYDALGLISCTGTNFLLRSRAFEDAGWFPEWTLTEDFALGIELKKRGWKCAYVNEYLAVGEAPDEVRNCFQQRSRWAKGHFQVFFSLKHNPCFGQGGKGLSLFMRWMYGNVLASYFSAFLNGPMFMLVPMITIWFGAFPIVINFWAAVAVTVYGGALSLMFYYTNCLGHLKSMWFASVANSILWWAFLKAMNRATIGRWLSGTIVFKVTAKGLQKLNNLPLRDIWMSTVWFIFCLVSLIFGSVHFFKANVLESPLAISLVFMVYSIIPQYLLLQYAVFRPRAFFNFVCKCAMMLSSAMLIMGIVLVWLLYPKSFDYKEALTSSIYFMDTQRVGTLPAGFRVDWRQTSFLSDAVAEVYVPHNISDAKAIAGLAKNGSTVTAGISITPGISLGGATAATAAGAAAFVPGANKTAGAFVPGATANTTVTPVLVPEATAANETALPAIVPAVDAVAPAPAAAVVEEPAAAAAAATPAPVDPAPVVETPMPEPEAAAAPAPLPGLARRLLQVAGLGLTPAPEPPAADPVAAAPAAAPLSFLAAQAAEKAAAAATPAATATAAGPAPAAGATLLPSLTPAGGATTAAATAAKPGLSLTAAPGTASVAKPGITTTGLASMVESLTAESMGKLKEEEEKAKTEAAEQRRKEDAKRATFGAFAPSTFSPEEGAVLASPDTWNLDGGWLTGMAAGNMKATYPVAFSTAVMAWAHLAFPKAFDDTEQTGFLKDSVRWGADYLMKVHKVDPMGNKSLLVTRIGDAEFDPFLWYRPEEGPVRQAYAVDLRKQTDDGDDPAGGDLAGSVAAALAASATLFQSSGDATEAAYAAQLLAKAKELYVDAQGATSPYTYQDQMMQELYNSTTVYDDLTWAAAWLYKATREDTYLADMYDFYVKHLQAESEISDWKYAFDWDNVFWPVNVLMADEDTDGAFKDQSEQFLKSWMCANNAANYTERGRAFNPMSNTLGSTANAAMLALIYADAAEAEDSASADTYRCWALSQMRYVLGDSGQSLVVGVGKDAPEHTQDRAAGCPPAPAVCNHVTGYMSPKPDSHELNGALVQGPGKSDDYMDVRNNDASRVGIESNAGFIGALAGTVLLPERAWDVCLQSFGIYRSNPVCGDFVAM